MSSLHKYPLWQVALYIIHALGDSQSIVAAPVTGSLVSSTLFSCRDVNYTARSALILTFFGTDSVLPARYKVLLKKTMDADGLLVVDNCAGVTFELYVPWDALEAAVDVSSAYVVLMRGVPDVIGLLGRRDSAVESRVLQGRDPRQYTSAHSG